MRFKIIRGSAQGLSYLHNNSVKKTIHVDIKLSNILLDEDLTAKIADFDLIRTFDIDETHQSTERTCGTMGYIPPEGKKGAYAKRISDKFDVYSFGVVILEIVTGERIHKFENSKTVYLLNHIWKHWNSNMAESLIDKDLEAPSKREVEEMLRCIHIGLLCAQENAQNRPNMLQVVRWLDNREPLEAPGVPGYWTEDSSEPNELGSFITDSGTSLSVELEEGNQELEAQCGEQTLGGPETNLESPTISRPFLGPRRSKSNAGVNERITINRSATTRVTIS